MSRFISLTGISFVCLALSQLLGCATMNRAECVNADWYLIGLEDGSAGRDLSYIGNHRSACSEYNVTPDIDRYRVGHSEGVKRFCTPERGYQLGLRGGRYPDICPQNLKGSFKQAWQEGRQLYDLRRDIASLRKDIAIASERLQWLEETIAKNEQIIIRSGTSETLRAQLLRDNKDYQSERDRLIESLPLMREDLYQLEQREAQLRRY